MANPRLQLRRGTQSPVEANVTTALAGEPFFDTSNDNLWIADGASSFVHIGGSSYTSRIDSFLTDATTTEGSKIVLKEGSTNGSDFITIKAPDSLAASYTITLPPNDGDESQFLQSDGNGSLVWATASVNSFTNIAVSGQNTVVADQDADTLTFAEGEGIDITTNSTTDTVTISAELATTSNLGVASFDATNFTVTSGAVTINDEYVQDTVGAMVSSNTESGIAVTYDDTNGKLDFNVADFTITLGGDLSGTVTITDLANATLTATIVANAVTLGTDTTGQYASTITGGSGLTATTPNADDATAYTISVGAGEGITVNADDVALKNGTNLVNNTVMGWDDANNQLTNSPVTYSGNDVSVAGDLTVTGNDIKSSGGTTAITLSGADVTIAGNLTVSGSSTILNTETLKVEDRIIELGLINGAAPTASTTWDTAVAFNYFATTAKKSAIVWVDNAGFELAATITETADTGNADPQITVGSRAALGVASLYIGSIGTADNEVITASKTITNVTIDCGTY